jgi:uncharacterized protein with beta-barrel porin domain
VPAHETVYWVQGVGAWGQPEGNGNAADVSRNLAGVFAGVDRRFGPNWLAGVAAGYTNSSVSVGDLASSAKINTAHLAGYVGPISVPGTCAALRPGASACSTLAGASSFPDFQTPRAPAMTRPPRKSSAK